MHRDSYMSQSGILVVSWPLVPGCDTGGIVVKAGKDAVSPLGTPFKEGDGICGCTRLGWPGYSPFQEYVSSMEWLSCEVPHGSDIRTVLDGRASHHPQT